MKSRSAIDTYPRDKYTPWPRCDSARLLSVCAQNHSLFARLFRFFRYSRKLLISIPHRGNSQSSSHFLMLCQSFPSRFLVPIILPTSNAYILPKQLVNSQSYASYRRVIDQASLRHRLYIAQSNIRQLNVITYALDE